MYFIHPMRGNERVNKEKGVGDCTVAGLKKVDPLLYQAACSRCFGRETVATIQLCSMTKPTHNGYYYIEHEVPF